MSKFIKILESNDPELQDNDDIKILNSLHRMCEGLGYNCNIEGTTLTITITEEEQETPATQEQSIGLGNAISAAVAIPDTATKGFSKSARSLKRVKDNVIKYVENLSKILVKADTAATQVRL